MKHVKVDFTVFLRRKLKKKQTTRKELFKRVNEKNEAAFTFCKRATVTKRLKIYISIHTHTQYTTVEKLKRLKSQEGKKRRNNAARHSFRCIQSSLK